MILTVIVLIGVCFNYFSGDKKGTNVPPVLQKDTGSFSYIADHYDGPYVVVNNNQPQFEKWMLDLKEAEIYSPLDSLGRCGPAYAVVTRQTMPKQKRGVIGHVRPTGWPKKYDKNAVPYNRCHLIGHQLCAEDDNVSNLITGTKYFNVTGMLPFENEVADYVKRKGKPVLYRVVPIFVGNELVARGVTMEAYSLQDNGKSVCFNVFVPNIQPGFVIDYKTGASKKVK